MYVMNTKIENYWSCVLENELQVDSQVVLILVPSVIHCIIWVSHLISVHLTGEGVVPTSMFLPGIK